jgi:hypothetical protein
MPIAAVVENLSQRRHDSTRHEDVLGHGSVSRVREPPSDEISIVGRRVDSTVGFRNFDHAERRAVLEEAELFERLGPFEARGGRARKRSRAVRRYA